MSPSRGVSRSGSSGRARKRIVLADDHAIVLEGLRRLIEPLYEVVATVGDGAALVAAVKTLRPDLVITDITMPVRGGIDATREIHERFPEIPVLALSMHADHLYLSAALQSGASGFAVKHAAGDELLAAIKALLAGGTFVTPLLSATGGTGSPPAPDPANRSFFDLTPRQQQVLQMIAEGRTSREIAEVLKLSHKTVEFHKYRIMETLRLGSTADLIRFATRHGIVPE